MATTGEPFGLFWDSENGDRTYSAASFEYWLKKFFTSGVFNGDLQVLASSGMTLEIQPGYANADGKVKFWNGAFNLTLNAANSTYPRIDTIVITRDNVNRQIVCEVVTGAYSGDTPQPTAPVRNSEIYQLVLAQIYVGAGVTGITQANITDTRPDTSLCGWITGTVEELDFSQFTAQFEQYFREFKADAEGDYESWFNEVQSEQIEDKEAWDAWYAALQEELHNLPEDSAEYLQIQIDELKESGLSGSIFKITTINASLEGKTVRVISADNTEEKTGVFDSNLECTIYGMKSVGEITITSTDGIQTATRVVNVPYFGNYNVPIAFWAATVNIQGDTNLYGATITIKDSDDLTVGTVILSSTDGTGTFTATKADTYSFNYTYQGTSYSQELVVSEETTYALSLSAGFSWVVWVDTAQHLDSSDYADLSEVLADEEAVRELFTEHACVDYMADSGSSNADLETIIENDLCAKWINNSDYALDFLGANTAIKALMDTADKYGYGEWTLMPQVPKMTSNTAPYGEAILYGVTQQDYNIPYKVFDGTTSTWEGGSTSYGIGVGYHFVNPTIVKKFSFKDANPNPSYTQKVTAVRIFGSNDNSNWTLLFEDDSRTEQYTWSSYNIDNEEAFSYYKAEFKGGAQGLSGVIIQALQFYAYAPKGNVPIMTANNAPYGEVSTNVTAASSYPAWKVFDGDDSTAFRASSSVSTASITYKFVNPINVRKFKYFVEYSNTPSVTFQMAYSDDGTNFSNAGNAISDTVGQTVRYHNIDDYGYHLYWKLTITFVGDSKVGICQTLQFYGRELKVSVPTMTSNTAPFGEVIKSSEYGQGQSLEGFRAFDGNDSTRWSPASGSFVNSFIGYKFPSSDKKIKMLYIDPYCDYNGAAFKHGYVQGFDGTDWVNIQEITGTNKVVSSTGNNPQMFDIETDNTYEGFRLFIDEIGYNNAVSLWTVQFYGLDYSEKEFEVGTTKKWLYDHGVEPSSNKIASSGYSYISSGGTYTIQYGTKNDSRVSLVGDGQNNRHMQLLAFDDAIAFADFSKIFIKRECSAIGGGDSARRLRIYSTKTTNNTPTIADLADNSGADGIIALDVSSINSNNYIWYLQTDNPSTAYADVAELWLE